MDSAKEWKNKIAGGYLPRIRKGSRLIVHPALRSIMIADHERPEAGIIRLLDGGKVIARDRIAGSRAETDNELLCMKICLIIIHKARSKS